MKSGIVLEKYIKGIMHANVFLYTYKYVHLTLNLHV